MPSKRTRSLSPAINRPSKRRTPSSNRSTPSANRSTPSTDVQAGPPQEADFASLFKGALIDGKLQTKLKLATRRTPRFLYRAWRSNEDRRSIDTPDSVTPQAFNTHDLPDSMFDLPKRVLANHALKHLKGPQEPSVFSCWTHSLHAAIEKALELAAEAAEGTHLCIIDTKRLPSGIMILHTSKASLGLIDKRISRVPAAKHKFLAYGVIQGLAYQAVSLEPHLAALRGWMRLDGPPELHLRAPDDLAAATSFGALFGQAFQLPIAAAMLAGYTHVADIITNDIWRTHLVQSLQDFAVPDEWMQDATIMENIAFTATFRDVRRTRLLLRSLVEQRFGFAACKMAMENARMNEMNDLFSSSASILDYDGTPFGSDAGTEADSIVSSGESEGGVSELPAGIMDEKTKRQIQAATRRTPRYLFRCWNNTEGPSGGYIGLNTTDAITPLGFSRGNQGASSIFHLTRPKLRYMAESHLRNFNTVTEFSSWAASLQRAILYARGTRENCYVSVIDTKKLIGNVIMHVGSMGFVLPAEVLVYDEEYMAHGVIQGPAHRAVRLSEVLIALPQYTPKGFNHSNFSSLAGEVETARRVGEQFGDSFVVPVTVAILTQKKRDAGLWRSGKIPELKIIADALADCRIPRKLCGDATILTDIVYTEGFEDVEQMIRLMRALVDERHGRGARGRSRSRAISPKRARAMSAGGKRVRVKKVRFEEDFSSSSDEGEDEMRGRKRSRQ
ncbi:hypothetical protein LTR08_003892 [Meristemomyces frigidus]|nr:hypothetical protein LTR08_003892 [Meristemomyces frigidus]